jgi:ketosteroid isomerase-like protein
MEKTKLSNMDIIRQAIAAGDNNDLEAWAQFISDKVHSHLLWDSYDDLKDEQTGYEVEQTREESDKRYALSLERFPHSRTTVEEMFDVGEDKVLTIYSSTLTHRSGKEITMKSMALERIEDGKIVEGWYSNDRMGYWQQLGFVPHVKELLAQFEKL